MPFFGTTFATLPLNRDRDILRCCETLSQGSTTYQHHNIGAASFNARLTSLRCRHGAKTLARINRPKHSKRLVKSALGSPNKMAIAPRIICATTNHQRVRYFLKFFHARWGTVSDIRTLSFSRSIPPFYYAPLPQADNHESINFARTKARLQGEACPIFSCMLTLHTCRGRR